MIRKMEVTEKFDWIDALRSGEYVQCRGALHRTKPKRMERAPRNVEEAVAHCCLGVYALVNHPEHWNEYPSAYGAMRPGLESEFAGLNDWGQMTFPEIAEWILDNVQGVL